MQPDMKQMKPDSAGPGEAVQPVQKPAMEVRDLFFSYGKNKVLKGTSFTIEEGKITTIMGANGCGKSTLFNLMTKNLYPRKGNIFLHGKNIQNLGLIVPHIGRLLVGSDHRALVPFSMLAGAFTFLLADTIGRTVAAPYEVSASIIMSVIGGPFFIILLRRSKKYAA